MNINENFRNERENLRKWRGLRIKLLIMALIFNESLARGDVADEWRQSNVFLVFIIGENMMLLTIDRCR